MDERRQAPWAERVLVERLSGGDETALAELYDRYAPFVYGLAVRTLVDRQIAEEVTQEVFVSLWEHPKQIEPGRGTLRGFLGTLTHRRAVDAVRREEAPAPEVRRCTARGLGARRCRRGAPVGHDRPGPQRRRGAPDAQRQALELAYFDGYTYRQVAEVLGIPEGTESRGYA